MNTSVQTFQFQNLSLTTVTDENGEFWFVAKEVADFLEYSDAEAMTRKLDEDEVQNLQIVGFNNRGVNVINESGLYSSILRSTKPEAKVFKKWVTSEVLPRIRKFGGFGTVKPRDYLAVIRQINTLTRQVIQSKNAFFVQTTLPQLQTLHTMIGSKMPALDLVTADLEQVDLFIGGVK